MDLIKNTLIEIIDVGCLILILICIMFVFYFAYLGIKRDIFGKSEESTDFEIFKENMIRCHLNTKQELRVLRRMMAGEVGSKEDLEFRKKYFKVREELKRLR